MKLKLLLLPLILICSYSALIQELSAQEKNRKQFKQPKELDNKFVLFKAGELGKLWDLDEKKDQLVYNPDSMRQASTYKKYIFSLKEFKKAGGNIKSDSKIYYRILGTETKNHTPEDPNLPSPSGGFTYITHKSKIIKVGR